MRARGKLSLKFLPELNGKDLVLFSDAPFRRVLGMLNLIAYSVESANQMIVQG